VPVLAFPEHHVFDSIVTRLQVLCDAPASRICRRASIIRSLTWEKCGFIRWWRKGRFFQKPRIEV